ncbi:hypothetical protein JTB14_024141 [Gonioctena quinquepunctata]|nr:hypothetical protein JTB14_024141 [Gonioctena quinquepunctata]
MLCQSRGSSLDEALAMLEDDTETAEMVPRRRMYWEMKSGAALQSSEEKVHGTLLEECTQLMKPWYFIMGAMTANNKICSKLWDGRTRLGLVRENRSAGNTLIDFKVLEENERGSYDYKKIPNQNVIAVESHDNSIVTL